MKKRPDAKTILKALKPYPAVFIPAAFGGTEVVFPNFPGSRTFGLNIDLAVSAAKEELAFQIFQGLSGGLLPAPSDPALLIPDGDEPEGTRIVMIEPDKEDILRRFGLGAKARRTAPDGQKYKR